jgi:23S rRNA (adenine2503-C2)-methyltransferase
MKLIRRIDSAKDAVSKYIFRTADRCVIEASYIDNGTGKDIVCVPTQTFCCLGCRFCHTTEHRGKVPYRNLTQHEIYEAVTHVADCNNHQPLFLVSYMGCGEPALNPVGTIESMKMLRHRWEAFPQDIRFGLATSLPRGCEPKFHWMTVSLGRLDLALALRMKLHLSLHYTTDALRKKWMPKSLPIVTSLDLASRFQRDTENPVEIHYALIRDLNDTRDDAERLARLLQGRDFNVKFLHYNERPGIDVEASAMAKFDIFKAVLAKSGIESEYYVPPGLDIGASCGQFLLDYYLDALEEK